MRPIIGIIGRSDMSTKERSTICVFDKYRRAVLKAGGIPIGILPTQPFDFEEVMPKDAGHLSQEEQEMLERQLSLCHGIIVPGGDRAYDYDRYAIWYANKRHIPLLGICMGMQQMCNYNNQNINVKNASDNHMKKEENYAHNVTLSSSKLYDIIGRKEFPVSSLHNYHVANSGDYKAVGYSKEGYIEAVEKDGVFNIGVQWHPEKNYDEDIPSQKLFQAFIKSAKAKMDEEKRLHLVKYEP